jgi:hypothetical protein
MTFAQKPAGSVRFSHGPPAPIGGRWYRRTIAERHMLSEAAARRNALCKSLDEEKRRVDALAGDSKTPVSAGPEPPRAAPTPEKSEANGELLRVLLSLEAVAADTKRIEDGAKARFEKDHPGGIPDTKMSQLYGDILKERNWVLDPGFGVSAPKVLAMLEDIPREMAARRVGPLHPFVSATHYFVYDETLHCVVMLQKVRPGTNEWTFARYYEAAPRSQVIEIFAACRGQTALSMRMGDLASNEWTNV